MERVREAEECENAPALVIIDNFKGQITAKVNTLLEDNNIHVCLLPPNTTDLLQPMDISVNKPAKEYLRRMFQRWYSEQIMERIEEEGVDATEITPIKLGMPILKELGAKWISEMGEYISDHPSIIVKGFIKSGISKALDGDSNEEDDKEMTVKARKT